MFRPGWEQFLVHEHYQYALNALIKYASQHYPELIRSLKAGNPEQFEIIRACLLAEVENRSTQYLKLYTEEPHRPLHPDTNKYYRQGLIYLGW